MNFVMLRQKDEGGDTAQISHLKTHDCFTIAELIEYERAKAVVDGNQVNIPEPGGGDEYRKLCALNGLCMRPGCSRK